MKPFQIPQWTRQRVGRGVSRASTKRCQICQKINVSFMIMTMPHDSMNNRSEYDIFILQLLTDPHVVRCFQPITDSWKDPENLNATLSSSKWGKHKHSLVLTMTIWILVCTFQSGETQTMGIWIPFQHT